MEYNWKNEKVYHPSMLFMDVPMNIYITGISLPNPDYRITHNTSQKDYFERYQFEYVIGGKGYIISEGKTIPVSKGDFFFLNKMKKIIYYSDKDDPMEKYFVTADGPLIDGFVKAYSMTDPVIVSRIDVEQNFINIMSYLEKIDKNYSNSINKIAIEILKIIQTLNSSKYEYNSRLVKNGDIAYRIRQYINGNLNRELTLDEISEYFFLSKSQIMRLFKKKYNTTPMKHALDQKIHNASQYLVESNMPVHQIADMLAFSDSKYFAKVFKKYTGQTPREFRKNKRTHYHDSVETTPKT